MADPWGSASVQYNDLIGTAAADGPDEVIPGIYEFFGLDKDKWWIVGIQVYGGEHWSGARAVVTRHDEVFGYQAAGEYADQHGGRIPVYSVRSDKEDAGIQVLRLLKRWDVMLENKHAIRDRGYVLDVQDDVEEAFPDEFEEASP